MNWFVREKDDYMFLYEHYYLFSYIIEISVDFNHIFTNNHIKFNVMNFHHLFYKTSYFPSYDSTSIIWDGHNLFEGRSPIILLGRREKGMCFFYIIWLELSLFDLWLFRSFYLRRSSAENLVERDFLIRILFFKFISILHRINKEMGIFHWNLYFFRF
jgi:hypothetical protein